MRIPLIKDDPALAELRQRPSISRRSHGWQLQADAQC